MKFKVGDYIVPREESTKFERIVAKSYGKHISYRFRDKGTNDDWSIAIADYAADYILDKNFYIKKIITEVLDEA